MTTGYKIASVAVVALFVWAWFASVYGWGLPSDASVRAKSVRQGSIHSRRVTGGGPGFGK